MEEKEFVPEASGTSANRYLNYNGLSILVDNIKELIAVESNSKRVVIKVPESKLSGNMFSNIDRPISFETEYTLDDIKKIMSPDVLVLFDFLFSGDSSNGIRGQLVAISKVDSTTGFDLTTSRGYASMIAIGVDSEWSGPNGTIFSIYFSKNEQEKYVININPIGSSLTDIGSLTESYQALKLYSSIIFDIDKGIESSTGKDFGENFWYAGSYLDSFDANDFWNNYICNHPILVKQNNILYPVVSKSIVTNASSYYQRDIVFEYFGANRKRNIITLGTYNGFPATCKLHEGDSCIFMHFTADNTDLSTSAMVINLSDDNIPIELQVKDYKERIILICDNYDESSCEVSSFMCTHIGNGVYTGMALDSSLNCITASISLTSKTVTISKKVIVNKLNNITSTFLDQYQNRQILSFTKGTFAESGTDQVSIYGGTVTLDNNGNWDFGEDGDNDIVIKAATKTSAGVMSAEDKVKLDDTNDWMNYKKSTDVVNNKTKLNNLPEGYVVSSVGLPYSFTDAKGLTLYSTTLYDGNNYKFNVPFATSSKGGFMSAEDKSKLDKIAAPPILQSPWVTPTTTTSASATISDLEQGQIKVFGDGYDMCLVALAGNNRSDRLIYLNWVCNVLGHHEPVNIGLNNGVINVTQEADYNILKNGYISTFQMGYTLAGVNSDGSNLHGRVTMTADGDGSYSGMKMLGDNLDRLIVFKIKPKEDTQQCYVTIKEIKFVE